MTLNEVRELAVVRGWNAASYAEAYGGTASFEKYPHYVGTNDAAKAAFQVAFALGVERYERGLFADGTPVE